MTEPKWEDDRVTALPGLNARGVRRVQGEGHESWLSRKCRAQAGQITALLSALAACKDRDLAERCLRAEAVARWHEQRAQSRESAYVKGYHQGYMDALARHEIDRP